MRHFDFIKDDVFVHKPVNFNKKTTWDLLKFALGATMYMPGTRNIYDAIIYKKWLELTSMVMCFEDAIPAEHLEQAEENVLTFLTKIASAVETKQVDIDNLPLFVIRVRNEKQFIEFTNRLNKKQIELLTAFNFPKMTASNVEPYFSHLVTLNLKYNIKLYGMPIIESLNRLHLIEQFSYGVC